MKTVEIFWTGGFDSSFRVCQLSRKPIIIQPYYLSDKRQSEPNELVAIKIITKKLRENKNTKAILNDIIYIPYDEKQTDTTLSEAYNTLRMQTFMGSQYEWLGAFAMEHKGIEMSIHKDDKAIELIAKHGKLKKITDEIGDYYIIDEHNSSKDCITVFGNCHFPLVDFTKLQMEEQYKNMGLSDVIDDTWFCFTPINGKPCGCCNPCKYTIEEGMKYRFTKEALRRYNHQRIKAPFSKALKKAKHFIKKAAKRS